MIYDFEIFKRPVRDRHHGADIGAPEFDGMECDEPEDEFLATASAAEIIEHFERVQGVS